MATPGTSLNDSRAIPFQPAPLLVIDERVGKGHKEHPPRITSTASTGRTPELAISLTSPRGRLVGREYRRFCVNFCVDRFFRPIKSEELTNVGTFDQSFRDTVSSFSRAVNERGPISPRKIAPG